MANFRVDLKLDRRTVAALQKRVGQAAADPSKALTAGAHLLETRAVELAPVQTGNLEASAVVQVSRRGESKAVAEVGFGAPYAADVHELPPHARGPRTRRKPAGKYGEAGPRYLLRAVRGVTGDGSLGRAIAEAYKRLFGG